MPGQPVNAQLQRRGIQPPKLFKCAACDLWKPASEFSKNQLSKWAQMKKSNDDGITPASIGLMCKGHNNTEPQIKCAGPCGKNRGRAHFSKSQRNKPQAWCKICTDWKLRWPGDEAPDAAPDEGVLVDAIHGEVITRANRVDLNIYAADNDDSDDDFSDGDISVDSNDESEDNAYVKAQQEHDESSEDDENSEEGSEDGRSDNYKENDRSNVTSVISAYQSTDFGIEHGWENQCEIAPITTSSSGLNRAHLPKISTNTMSIPPHLRPPTLPGGISAYTSKTSSRVNPSRLSETSSGFHAGTCASTQSATSSQGATSYRPNLHNAAAFTPQADITTSTTYPASQNGGPAVSTTTTTTNRSNNSRFYKGDNRSIFHAPRPFVPLQITDTKPLTHNEESQYSGDSSDDF